MTNRTVEAAEIAKLAERVADMRREDNAVDVLVEVALFEPTAAFTGCRANAAGTKVIFTTADGRDATSWADDWTFDAARRRDTAQRLRARANSYEEEEQPNG